MKIAFNPTTALTSAPLNNDITFDLVGHNIYARGVKFAGTDTTYDVFRKDTSNSTGGRIGLVPVPDYNNNSLTRFLREDGTWANIQIPTSTTYTFEGGVNSFKVTPSNGTTLTIQITPNVTLNDILCGNYTIATEIKNIATTDTLNSALGKLEYKADLGVTAYSLISAANNGESIDNLAEILKVLEGIKDTDTIQAIIGKYLPLSGGMMVGNITFDTNRLIRWHQSDAYSISCPTDSNAAYLLLKGFSGTTINKRLSVYKSDTSTPNSAYTIYTDGSVYASSATFGTVNLGSGDLNFKGADPGDIAWYDADNKEKGRIYYNAGALSLRHDAGTTYKILHTGNAGISNGTITINGVSITPLTSKPSYAWSEITGKPTTISGYGITDTFKIVDDGNAYLNLSMPSAALSKKATSTYIECWDGSDDAGWWNWKAGKWITVGGTSSHFVKGDGSLDSTTYATSASLGNYLPLTGGTITGTLNLSKEGSDILVINRLNSSSPTTITYRKDGTLLGRMGFDASTKEPVAQVSGTYQTLIHSGNVGSYALPLSGGTMTGVLSIQDTVHNNNYIKFIASRIGSGGHADNIISIVDSEDNTHGRFGIYGTTSLEYIYLGLASTYNGNNLRVYSDKVTFGDSTLIHSGNIGSQTVAAANKLSTARTIWGQSFDGSKDVSGSIYLPNNSQIVWRTSDGVSYYNAMYLSTNNHLVIGNDIATAGRITYLSGNEVYLRYGILRTNGICLNSSGNVTIGSSDLAGTSYKLYVGENGKIFTESKNDIDTRTVGSNNGASVSVNATDTGWLGSGGEMRFCLGGGTVVGVIKGKYTTWNQQFNPTVFGSLSFYTRDTTTGNLTERMIIRDNGNVGIGTTDPKYKLDVNGTAKISGAITASSFIKSDSSDSYVLLGGGGHKAISDFMLKSDELTNNLISIKKTLTVSKDWMDTGIVFDSTTFTTGSGSYVVLLSWGNLSYVWTGFLSIFIKDNISKEDTDEIILHGGGFDTDLLLYLRTVHDTTNKIVKLQIAGSKAISEKAFTFKFKKLI